MPLVPPIYADLTDYIARAALVEGYNTNTYQAQDNPNVPVLERHPAPFTGVEGDIEMRLETTGKDLHVFRVSGRLMHYEPLVTENQSDDAAANAAWISRWTLSPRTWVGVTADGHVSTLNGAHLADTSILAFDPTLYRRTYWLSTEEARISHELSETWRIQASLGSIFSGTIYQPPLALPGGQLVEHRGLDYVTPYVNVDLYKAFSDRVIGDAMILYQYAYELYVLDLTQNPPRNIGPDKQAFLTFLPGFTYKITQEWSNSLHLGGVVASAPPQDFDQRPIVSPAGNDVLTYNTTFWSLISAVGYTYGTLNPRLGAGPSLTASTLVMGTPSRVGNWKNFSLLINAQANYATLLTGVTESTRITTGVIDAEFRYALSPWIGLLGGYEGRATNYNIPGQYLPPFVQDIVFFGVSGYWSTNKDIPALTTFVAPITPPT